MKTLNENELVEISASGDMPVASWPAPAIYLPALNLSWLSWLLGTNTVTSRHNLAD